MDFSILTENFVVVVLVACLVVGYIIKTSFSFVPNKYIPTILAVIGAILLWQGSGEPACLPHTRKNRVA